MWHLCSHQAWLTFSEVQSAGCCCSAGKGWGGALIRDFFAIVFFHQFSQNLEWPQALIYTPQPPAPPSILLAVRRKLCVTKRTNSGMVSRNFTPSPPVHQGPTDIGKQEYTDNWYIGRCHIYIIYWLNVVIKYLWQRYVMEAEYLIFW